MDTLHAMKTFLAVADSGGFTAAAKALDTSVPSVTRLVASLEEQLGARLLQRTTRKVSLTPAGALYAEQVRSILDAVDEAASAARQSRHALGGLLRIITMPLFAETLLAPLLPVFQQRYPDIVLEVEVDADPVARINHFDLALLSAREGLDANIVARQLTTVDGVLCAAPAYLQQAPALNQPADLAQHRCLLRRSSRLRKGVIELWEQGGDIQQPPAFSGEVAPALTINHASSLLQMCLSGMGVAALASDMAAPYLASGRLQQVLPGWISGRFTVLAALPSRRHLPQRVQVLLDLLGEHFEQQRLRQSEQAIKIELSKE